jgi:Mn2+/Fe2+ NRAMP family transporter
MLAVLGPGIVVAMAWLGTGDLINSAVSGANYGYALMWAMVLALGARLIVTSALAKYQLCNKVGDERILQGYQRVWRGFPLAIGIGGMILAFTINGAIMLGAGTALHKLTGGFLGDTWGPFLCTIAATAGAIALSYTRREYKAIEWVARIVVAVLLATFVYAVIRSGFNPVDLFRGLAFDLPSDTGVLAAGLVVVSLIGAVGGSVANLLYGYLIEDKGWKGPTFRPLQRIDLWSGVIAMIIVNIAIWIVAAENLAGSGITIDGPEGLEQLMVMVIGSPGIPLLWLAVFAICFDNLHVWAYGFTKLFVDGVHLTFPARGERYRTLKDDPLFRPMEIGLFLMLPLVFAIPGMPNMVVLTVIANSFNVFLVPGIVIGLILLTSRKKYMLDKYVNRWWETLLLIVIGVIALWATYEMIQNIAGYVTG